MANKKREIKEAILKVDSELLYKYKYICRYYGHTFNDQVTFTMRRYVYNFELNHGPISIIRRKSSKARTE